MGEGSPVDDAELIDDADIFEDELRAELSARGILAVL